MSRDPQDTAMDRWRRKRWEFFGKPADKAASSAARGLDYAAEGIDKGIAKIQKAIQKEKKKNSLSPVLIEIVEHALTRPPGLYTEETLEELKGKERLIYKAKMEHQKKIQEQFNKDLSTAWQRYLNAWKDVKSGPRKK